MDMRTPIRRTRSGRCAYAASGQVAADPTIALTTSRRRIAFPRPKLRDLAPQDYSRDLRQAKWGSGSGCTAAILRRSCPLWVKADIEARPVNVCFTPKSGHWLSVSGCPLCAKSGHQPASDWPFIAAPNPLRGLVFRHCNHGAGKRAIRLSQLIQNREVIGVGDRYQVAWDMP